MGAHQDRRQFWRAHFERCRELGMTLKSYAEQEGLTVSVFYGWSKRFKREQTNRSKFSKVTIAASTPAEYRLRFPSGLVLEWVGDPDAAQLARLVKLLA